MGFFTGSAISLMHDCDLHPECKCLLLNRQLGRQQSCTSECIPTKWPHSVWYRPSMTLWHILQNPQQGLLSATSRGWYGGFCLEPIMLHDWTAGSASGSQCFTTPHRTRQFIFSVTERVFSIQTRASTANPRLDQSSHTCRHEVCATRKIQRCLDPRVP